MTLEQALNILNGMCSRFNCSETEHAGLNMAMQTIINYIQTASQAELKHQEMMKTFAENDDKE